MAEKYPLVISVHRAAQLLDVTPTTAYSWARQGEIPSIRLGGRIRIPVAKLADLLGVDPADLVADDHNREGESRP